MENKQFEINFINFLKKIKNNRIFILTGKQSYNKSGARYYVNKYLINKNLNIFFKKEKYPKISELKKIILKIKKIKPQYILAIGGGSVMDYAKIANCLDNTKINLNIRKANTKLKKKSIVVAIPTTAGSGSEVTSGAVIYINKIKYSVEGKEIVPDNYFLVPKLIMKNSKSLKASSGFDAISQSVESLISRKSSNKSVKYAKKSLEILFKSYPLYLKEATLDRSLKMLIGSNFSGKAISISKTTAPHAVSYPLTSHYNIPHGNAVSLTINEFLDYNFNNINKADVNFNLKKRFKLLFKISGTRSITEFLKFLDKLKKKAKLENQFRKIKVPRKKIISKVMSGINIRRLSNNPIQLTKDEVKMIISKNLLK